ncbi:MAG TPA: hypothetical protein HPP66_01400 [Planctomycetes bacterium]|nr:hypothetical protein [Planctomycetota bacterium]
MKSLKENWKAFLHTILDPWIVILLIATGILLVISVRQGKQQTPPPAVYSALLNLMLIVSSGILGARLTKQWLEQTESGILVVRGKTAIRNLKLLMHNIAMLGTRVRMFTHNIKDQAKAPKAITTRNYEEIVSKCDSLAEEAVNSIENWTDIIPEANVRTQIGELTELRNQLNQTMIEFARLQKEIKETKSRSAEQNAQLKNQLENKESKIRELRSEILSQQTKVGSSLLGTVVSTLSDANYPSGLSISGRSYPFLSGLGGLTLTDPGKSILDQGITFPEKSDDDAESTQKT